MASFIRIKKQQGKNGRVYEYRYFEERWWEGGKVRSRSTSLGPVSGRRRAMSFLEQLSAEDADRELRLQHMIAAHLARYAEHDRLREERQKAERQAAAKEMFDKFGMVTKDLQAAPAATPASSPDAVPDASAPAPEQPSEQSPSDGQGKGS